MNSTGTTRSHPRFDPAAEASRLRTETRVRRRRRHFPSRLDRYTSELLALRDEGCTTAELQRWLHARRVDVHHTTVGRWLRRNAGPDATNP